MTEAPPPITPDDAIFARLAEMDLALAEKAHAQAMAADEPAAFASAARTYQRMARSVRQTLFLKARIARERAAQAERDRKAAARQELYELGGGFHTFGRDFDALPGDDRIAAGDARIIDLQKAVGRVIHAARPDGAGHQSLYERLDAWIDLEIERPDFADDPLDAQVRAACEHLGLPEDLAASWRKLPETPWITSEDWAEPDAPDEPTFTASG